MTAKQLYFKQVRENKKEEVKTIDKIKTLKDFLKVHNYIILNIDNKNYYLYDMELKQNITLSAERVKTWYKLDYLYYLDTNEDIEEMEL